MDTSLCNTSLFSDNDETILNSEEDDESESTSKSHSSYPSTTEQEWVPVVPTTPRQIPPVPKKRSSTIKVQKPVTSPAADSILTQIQPIAYSLLSKWNSFGRNRQNNEISTNANGNGPNSSTASTSNSATTNKARITNKNATEYNGRINPSQDNTTSVGLEYLLGRADHVFVLFAIIIIFLLSCNFYCVNQLRNQTAEQHKEILISTQQLIQQFQKYERNLNTKIQQHGEIQLILFKSVLEEGFEKLISKINLPKHNAKLQRSHDNDNQVQDYDLNPSHHHRRQNVKDLQDPEDEEGQSQHQPSDYSFELPSMIKDSFSKLFSSQQQQQSKDFISNSAMLNEANIQKLKENLESMQSTYFPNQQRETWVQIWSAVSLTLETSLMNSVASSARPASIVILQKESSKNIGHCFMKILAKNINNAISEEDKDYKVKELSPEYFSMLSSPTTINDDILEHLQYKGKVIQIHRVNEIQRVEHLYIFHSLCDNYMAPDPKAVFLFLITIPNKIEADYDLNWTHDNGIEIVRKFLSKSWENVLDDDKRAPLIARIAANVVLIQNNKNEDLEVLNSSECL